MISIAIVVWLAIGFFMLRFEGGWLIMITDSRNTPRTWMALPSMFLCMVLWPINKWVARHCFYLSITRWAERTEYHDMDPEFLKLMHQVRLDVSRRITAEMMADRDETKPTDKKDD